MRQVLSDEFLPILQTNVNFFFFDTLNFHNVEIEISQIFSQFTVGLFQTSHKVLITFTVRPDM